MRRTIASASIATASLLGAGGIAASLIGVPGAGAVTANPTATSTDPTVAAAVDPSTRLTSTIGELVTDGTLTQAQADKVIAALKAAGPVGGPRGGRGGGPSLDVAAKTLGVTATDLAASLRAGKSLADVAKDKGVVVQNVIDVARWLTPRPVLHKRSPTAGSPRPRPTNEPRRW